jgi:hypothetical protein
MTNIPFILEGRVTFLCGVIDFFIVVVSHMTVSSGTVVPKMRVVGGDDITDGGMTEDMRGSTLHVHLTTLSAVGTAAISALLKSVGDSKPSVEPRTFFFITPSSSVYGKSFVHGQGRWVRRCSVPRT